MPTLLAAYEEVAAKVAAPLSAMYRTQCEACGDEATAQYTAWVKQVPCESCGEQDDLHLSNVIMADMASKGAGLVDCPSCVHPWWVEAVGDRVKCPRCAHRFLPSTRRTKNTHYHCNGCGRDGRILDALGEAHEPPGHRMRCLTVWCERCGKRHQAPSAADFEQYAAIAAETKARFNRLQIPRSEIPEGYNTNQMRRYGYRFWWQMFNFRQLAGLDRLFRAIREIEDSASRELLTLLASGSLEFNSMFCGAKGLGTGAIRHVFAHHAFIPVKEPLEANLWGVHRSSGCFSTLFKERLLRGREWAEAPVERRFLGTRSEKVPIPGERLAARPADNFRQLVRDEADMLVLNQSSEDLYQIPDASVDLVITDPPYADSVMYSELSDYFYVWLREALGYSHLNFLSEHVDDRREAVHNSGRGRDGDFYSHMLGLVFVEAMRVLKPRGRLTFTFHHSGEDAWEQVLAALRTAGIVVERWWPVFAEMESGVPIRGKENNGHLDIVFVCGRRHEIVCPGAQDPLDEITHNLSQVGPLVAADHRALINAQAVAEASWLAPDMVRAAA
jgi:putative DNA methylase